MLRQFCAWLWNLFISWVIFRLQFPQRSRIGLLVFHLGCFDYFVRPKIHYLVIDWPYRPIYRNARLPARTEKRFCENFRYHWRLSEAFCNSCFDALSNHFDPVFIFRVRLISIGKIHHEGLRMNRFDFLASRAASPAVELPDVLSICSTCIFQKY